MGSLAPWLTRQFLSQRRVEGVKLSSAILTDKGRVQVIRLTGKTIVSSAEEGEEELYWGEANDGEGWIDCCFTSAAKEAFEKKSTRTLGGCSSTKSTIKITSWRFILGCPSLPPRSPSKHRPATDVPLVKDRRICLRIEGFEFYADGDEKTILAVDGGNGVGEWRKAEQGDQCEVLRAWVEKIEASTESGGEKVDKGKKKEVVCEADLQLRKPTDGPDLAASANSIPAPPPPQPRVHRPVSDAEWRRADLTALNPRRKRDKGTDVVQKNPAPVPATPCASSSSSRQPAPPFPSSSSRRQHASVFTSPPHESSRRSSSGYASAQKKSAPLPPPSASTSTSIANRLVPPSSPPTPAGVLPLPRSRQESLKPPAQKEQKRDAQDEEDYDDDIDWEGIILQDLESGTSCGATQAPRAVEEDEQEGRSSSGSEDDEAVAALLTQPHSPSYTLPPPPPARPAPPFSFGLAPARQPDLSVPRSRSAASLLDRPRSSPAPPLPAATAISTAPSPVSVPSPPPPRAVEQAIPFPFSTLPDTAARANSPKPSQPSQTSSGQLHTPRPSVSPSSSMHDLNSTAKKEQQGTGRKRPRASLEAVAASQRQAEREDADSEKRREVRAGKKRARDGEPEEEKKQEKPFSPPQQQQQQTKKRKIDGPLSPFAVAPPPALTRKKERRQTLAAPPAPPAVSSPRPPTATPAPPKHKPRQSLPSALSSTSKASLSFLTEHRALLLQQEELRRRERAREQEREMEVVWQAGEEEKGVREKEKEAEGRREWARRVSGVGGE
ncbi:hypothetical protein JCM8547_003654 [Rhodosporidiobolus lusitaniae]